MVVILPGEHEALGAMWEKNELNFHICDFNLSISIVAIELIQVVTAVLVYHCGPLCRALTNY